MRPESDVGRSFADADSCSSDSELEDVVRQERGS